MKFGTALFLAFLIFLGLYTTANVHVDMLHAQSVITVVDMSKPSNEPRLTVYNKNTGAVLMRTYCTHGEGSGDLYATRFSNSMNSHCTSLGRYITTGAYYEDGHLRCRLIGLDRTNSNAYKRNIVVHGAYYASQSYILAHGKAGTSWGCIAVSFNDVDRLVQLIAGGSELVVKV